MRQRCATERVAGLSAGSIPIPLKVIGFPPAPQLTKWGQRFRFSKRDQCDQCPLLLRVTVRSRDHGRGAARGCVKVGTSGGYPQTGAVLGAVWEIYGKAWFSSTACVSPPSSWAVRSNLKAVLYRTIGCRKHTRSFTPICRRWGEARIYLLGGYGQRPIAQIFALTSANFVLPVRVY